MKNVFDLIFSKDINLKDYFLNEEEENISFFPKFNSINIIIGANNSGKSRFIRRLMSNNYFAGVKDLHLFKNEVKDYNREISQINNLIDSQYESYDQKSKTTIYVGGGSPDAQKAKILYENRLKELYFDDFENITKTINQNKININNLKIFQLQSYYLSNYSTINNDFIYVFRDFKKYYIPTLRTAHSLFNFVSEKYSKIESDIYLETLNNNYQLDKIDVDVFTGLHLYKEILNSRNSEKSVREQFEKFENFLRDNFFDGKEIDIVAKFDKNDNEKGINESELIIIHVAGDKDRKLYDLGDGIQALIVLMYKIFMAESESFIFIDEPELNLHPGMQRLFLEQITNNEDLKKKNLRYVITTHSNHFLDLTIEKDNVSIYSFSPRNNKLNDKHFIIKNVNRGDNKLLKELGVNNSSVFMANCSIWVEGISDRNYIKAFLKSYCDSIGKSYPKEDIDFAFFEYAGSNIDHYIFEDEIEDEKKEFVIKDIKSLSLSNRIFLLADSDAVNKTKNKQKFERLEALKNAESDNFKPKIIWNVREIENLLTNDIWKKVMINFCNEKLVNQYAVEIQNKIELALGKIDADKFKKEYIGNFLYNLREEISKKGKVYILNKSFFETKKNGTYGTIIDKRGLSEKVLEADFPWIVFSKNKEIKNLTIEIYNFITQK
ncbi:hypothetical protein ASE21_01865 [Flavobacterium sp. Root901]|uniref:AAA family ATPase n=1 Tax=Flavobacterium sp. Root901 TaxID=1736605 RepID=UPI0007099C83|nr:AAA family ATPase [Flavobacterium sp. Root901]KRD12674.1 hypothetical protein ASE21_01865 [Flavobacterium sp. Root901]